MPGLTGARSPNWDARGGPVLGENARVKNLRATVFGVLRPQAGHASRWSLLAIVFAGGVLRAIPLIGHDWPIGDGGLFYAMVGELRANGLSLPMTSAYNHAAIPFAYPPLALELTALLESVTVLTRAELFQWMPLMFSTLCIPAVYLLARELLADRPRALFATLVYATFPFAWEWLTMGSGPTRSVGMVFALLATWQGLRVYREGRWSQVLATGLLAGLAVLSHPESGAFVVIALGTRLLFDRSWRNVRNLALAAGVGFVVISPWVGLTVARHGLAPFLAAAAMARDPTASLVVYLFGFLAVSPLPVAALLDLLGQVRSVVTRRPFLVAWRIAICFLDLRFALVAAVVPFSLLATEGLFDVLVPAVRAAARGAFRSSGPAESFTGSMPVSGPLPTTGSIGPPVASVPMRWLVGLAAIGLAASSLATPSVFLAPHVALSTADRAAMAWVRDNEPTDRRYVVLATDTWGSDDLSEWFPALSGHANLTTSQGLEWVDPAIRSAEGAAQGQLQLCQPADLPCLIAWLAAHGGQGTGVYVPAAGSAYATGADPSGAIRAELLASPDFMRVYAGPGAMIFVTLH